MSDKKNIDRLFQEKFKDFEVKPSNAVWSNIQEQINTAPKRKTRVIPLWLKISGIAATLLLLLTLGNVLFNSNSESDPINKVVETKENDTQTINNEKTNKINELTTSTSNSTNDNTLVTSNNDSTKNSNKNSNTLTNKENTIIVSSSNSQKSNTTTSNKNSSQNTITNKENTGITSSNNNLKSNTSNTTSSNKNNINPKETTNKKIYSSAINKNNEAYTNNDQKANKDAINTSNSTTKDNSNLLNKYNSTPNNAITNTSEKNKPKNNSGTSSEEKLKNNSLDNTAVTNNTKVEEKINEKPSLEDTITKEQSIEDAIAESEDLNEKEKEEVTNRWNVYTNVAPVYYNSLGKGSHIHDQFIENPKSGELNASYGVTVGYALNDKFTVRTGVNKLNLSYDTDNVIVYNNVFNSTTTDGANNSALRNITFKPNSTGENISLLSANGLNVQQTSSLVGNNLKAAISQRISYYEIPVEVEYNIVNSKFGVSLIGGVSSFISDGNDIVSEIAGQKTKIGEANNINPISFSTNLGLGLDYKFSKAFEFKLEPTFKYQLNAFNNTSGNFRPYIIGVYTGLSYKF